ncbi:MAG TPA: N-6 DNA methylase [Bacteroidia bacterium]|nr:N-6 DNA methylase [Bacteroidia bacterium]
MRTISEELKPFSKVFDQIANNKSDTEVFNDFLDIAICALSHGAYEEEYFSIIKKYNREQVNLFSELFAKMVIAMDAKGQGLKDCLGEFYEQRLSRGRQGQFFTPDHVCLAMASMTINMDERGKTIIDPCCGSGRMLLSAAKVARHNYFYAIDIDHTCVKMTTINFALNGLMGEVAWMDALGGPEYHWGGYTIWRVHGLVPVIRKLKAGEGLIVHSPPYNKKTEEQVAPKNSNTITLQTKLDL